MNPTRLDHVAFWLADRDAVADFATSRLGMHVIERTDAFTLLGSDARRGKLVTRGKAKRAIASKRTTRKRR